MTVDTPKFVWEKNGCLVFSAHVVHGHCVIFLIHEPKRRHALQDAAIKKEEKKTVSGS